MFLWLVVIVVSLPYRADGSGGSSGGRHVESGGRFADFEAGVLVQQDYVRGRR